jgi:hypothetical protein
MADTLAVDVRASLGWLFVEALDLGSVADNSRLEYARSLADGTAVDQADRLWHDQRTLAGSASENLDLTNLTNTLFGSTVTVNFAKVKALLIINLATTAGEDLLVGGAGAGGNAWSAPFDADADAKIAVPADSMLLLVNKKNGWTVTNGSSDILKIANASGASVSYKIAIVGTSA